MTSAHDILKGHGDWIQSKDFLALVAEKLELKSERQAYRRVKEDVRNKLIVKLTLPDRRVVYGLPTWPLKGSVFKATKTDGIGFFDWLERRTERKRYKIRKLEAEYQILLELIKYWEKHGQKTTLEYKWKLREKWGKRYKVDPADLYIPAGV